MPPHILLTIDVEDWFQVENFKPWIPFSSWPSCELRVERNVHRLLDLFDELSPKESGGRRQEAPSSHARRDAPQANLSADVCGGAILGHTSSIRATFFVLGWIAERLPHLVREIHARGHEVASHGYCHTLCCDQSCGDLTRDLSDSKKLLEDTIGSKVYGYRAPSFSISNDILIIIRECGYVYDSSFNSFALHGRYGKLNLASSAAILKRSDPQAQRSLSANGTLLTPNSAPGPLSDNRAGIAHLISESFYELPISNVTLGKRIFPLGGGAYFRFLPSAIFHFGVRRILKRQGDYLFYFHPWELDPDQPCVEGASANFKFRHYLNLGKTHQRLERFIKSFSECRFVTCKEYLDSEVGRQAQERRSE